MSIIRPPCIGLDWSEAGFFASTHDPTRKRHDAQSKTRDLEADTSRHQRERPQRPRHQQRYRSREQGPQRQEPLLTMDDRIRIDTRVSPKLRDAIVAGAQARQITVDKWMRLAVRDALRQQGIPQ
jgi:hypothetical protein